VASELFVAAALTYAVSEFAEGTQDVLLGVAGSNKTSVNPLRDTIFGGDQSAYDTVGAIVTTPFAFMASVGIGAKSYAKSSTNDSYEGEAVGVGNVRVGSDFGTVGMEDVPLNDIQKNFNKVMNKSKNSTNSSSAGVSDEILFGQRRISDTFNMQGGAPDYIRGRKLTDVAEDLKKGILHVNIWTI
jgi:hypothetical protein